MPFARAVGKLTQWTRLNFELISPITQSKSYPLLPRAPLIAIYYNVLVFWYYLLIFLFYVNSCIMLVCDIMINMCMDCIVFSIITSFLRVGSMKGFASYTPDFYRISANVFQCFIHGPTHSILTICLKT